MFIYDQIKRLVAFETGPVNSTHFFISIGGLTDGFLGLPYIEQLAKKLNEKNWSLIQILLSSSYSGYGTSSLKQDSEEIDQLLGYLQSTRSLKELILCGHSTGCQDVLFYLKNPSTKHKNLVHKIILQAAVSDHDYMATLPNFQQYFDYATRKVLEGKGHELMDMGAHSIPITAYRYHSLGGLKTDDDMFSESLTDDDLRSIYSHKPVPTLLVNSGGDEYVPKSVDGKKLTERIGAILKAKIHMIEGAPHNTAGYENQFVSYVVNFVSSE